MKITIPKVVVPVNLGDYAPPLAGQNLYVWVNPPMAKLQAYDQLVIEMQSADVESAQRALFPTKRPKESGATSPLQRTFDLVRRVLSLKKDRKVAGLDQGLLDWYLELWNQGPQEAHWTVEELRLLEAEDPAFLSWMIAQTWKARSEHAEAKKKA